MKALFQKDLNRRKTVQKYLSKRLCLNFLYKNEFLPKKVRYAALLHLTILPKNSSKVRIKNRCIFSYRGRSIYSKFRMSRIEIRRRILKGLLPGFKKSSW